MAAAEARVGSGRRFELRRKLGEGSFGEVYLADMVSLGGFRTRVALKVLNHRWGPDSDPGRRLRDEARLLGRLHHHNIVRVHDLVRVDGRWAVVMEALRGVDLEHLQRGASTARLPARAALELVAAVADALHAALHEPLDGEAPLRVVHRDIKPSNLILTADGVLKVLDFGIARADFDSREASTSSVGFGSLPYMSPERLLGDEATAAGDVYSLGALLFELLVGQPLGRVPIEASAGAAHRAAAQERLREALAGEPTDEECRALVERMLSWVPEDRPDVTWVRDLARDLARRAGGQGLAELAAHEVPRVLAAAAGEAATGTLSEETGDPAPAPRPLVVSNPTLVAGDMALLPEAPAGAASATETVPLPPPTPPGPRVLPWVLGLGTVAALVLAAVLAWPRPPARAELPTAAEAPAAEVTAAEAPAAEVTAAEAPAAGTTAAEVTAAEAIPAEASTAEAPTSEAPVEAPPAEAPPTSTSARTGGSAARGPAPPAAGSPAPPEAAPPAAPAAAVATVRQVKVVAPGASTLRARCGARSGEGSSSLVVRDAPVGTCTVEATVDGQVATGTVQVSAPAAFQCTVEQGALACR